MGVERLFLWIEGQSFSIIALVAFGLCYASAAVIFVLSRVIASRRFAAELKGTTPVMLTPLAVILGLLLAFVASRVWNHVDNANDYVRQEASAIQETLALADTLPASVRTEVRKALKHYLEFTAVEDWPAMMEGRANAQALPPGLTDAMQIILSFAPSERGQEIAQQRAAVAIMGALEARRNRITLSGASVMPVQWIAILIIATLMLATIAVVHLDRPLAMAANLFSLSTAVGACFMLLLVNDRPFSAGGIVVEPDTLTLIAID